ncbi:acetyl-CoA carboxylase, carboxyltransferase subunit beta [Thalassospira sp. MCCC 1A03138]|uniref:acetyl-CoA carboxylase, carboxyltransferase subunit beta n=1 Tax=Thalassospira sp. MCCC 1A03138 TaxID=1470576 RepID=UPI000A1E07B4|nr:acetyl-CoA carboxylase, carboxyltransferase subunit beta [Thalassospira sp. MCCC 1A03138]OSQ31633.1 acetyl-CoA carboxyl transferase [Thalassospira sp. MCCC 1A03138]
MSWLTEFVRPKIQKLVRRTDVPENLWHKCPSCEQMIFHRDLAKNKHVCQHCGHHMRISAKERLELLFDDGKYQTIELPSVPVDPLKFRDQKKYTDRLKAAQAKATYKDALAVAHGDVGGHATVVAVFDFSFMGGSMGTAVGEGIVAAAELATVQDAALIIVPASGGARMQEGILSLMQMARTTAAIEKVKEKGLPYFVLLTDPTTGGVSASFAMLGDIQIAEPGAQIGFAGRRVIENTIREKLPDDFQTAEYLLDHGMVDMVVPRGELNETIGRLIDMIRRTKPGAAIVPIKDAKKKPAKKAETEGDNAKK